MNEIHKRVEIIRQWLKKNGLDAIIIPHEDEYLSEYIPPENERLAWITGFTGSAGLAIITQDKAAIFVDGRYTVQVKEQVDSSLYTILHISKDPYLKWLKTILNSNAQVGYDSRLQRANWKKTIEKSFAGNITLIPIDQNPIDLFWDDRPSGNMDKAILLDEKYTGMASQGKRKEYIMLGPSGPATGAAGSGKSHLRARESPERGHKARPSRTARRTSAPSCRKPTPWVR